MNDVGAPVRKAFYDALNNQVANPESITDKIPIVDEKLDLNITEHDLYMLIGAQTETPANTKQTWGTEVDLSITVVNRRKATNSKTSVENITGQILNIIFPTRTTYGISVSSPFKLSFVRKTEADYDFQRTPDGWQISKKITFKTRVTEQTF